ncbi:MAG: hypothetical protein JRJ40_10605 [Deltaproteobacteria bacterium]|nr:hypothetical protein [Deltaproteobacteria bacterium]
MEGISKERGEHISCLPKFEDIEAWQLARELARKINGRKATLNHEPLNP